MAMNIRILWKQVISLPLASRNVFPFCCTAAFCRTVSRLKRKSSADASGLWNRKQRHLTCRVESDSSVWVSCWYLLLYNMYVSCHRHFFLVLLLNQRWSPPLRLQVSHCSTFRIMCDVIIIIIIIIFIIIIIINNCCHDPFCNRSGSVFQVPNAASRRWDDKLVVWLVVNMSQYLFYNASRMYSQTYRIAVGIDCFGVGKNS